MSVQSELLSYYKVDNDGTDSKGSADLTITGGTFDPTIKVVGPYSLNVDGLNDSAKGAFTALKFDDAWAINFWVYIDIVGRPANGTMFHLTDSDGVRVFTISFFDAGGDRLLVSRYSNSAIYSSLSGSLSPVTWYNFSVEHAGGVGGRPNIYQDTVDVRLDSPGFFGGFNDPGQLYVGQRGNGLFFDGKFDNIPIYSRELTASERTQLYNGGAGFEIPLAVAAARRRRMLIGRN